MIVAISRAECYSPNSVDKDARILEKICELLTRSGFDVKTVNEQQFTPDVKGDIYISMARSPRVLDILKKVSTRYIVVNNPWGVEKCQDRRLLMDIISHSRGINAAPKEGNDGYWVKKNFGYTECESDIIYAPDTVSCDQAVESMKSRGIKDVYTCAHIKGTLVKFYGVLDTPFFRCYCPRQDGDMKFASHFVDDDACSDSMSVAMSYISDDKWLRDCKDKIEYMISRKLNGMAIYGGDMIVTSDGKVYVIDLNDFPSFSRCVDEAAEYMVMHIIKRKVNLHKQPVAHCLLNSTIFKGLLFDYGGTLDTGGIHWGMLMWQTYQRVGVPIDEQLFREAYVHGERTLGRNPIIKSTFSFRRTIMEKISLQLEYIHDRRKDITPADWHKRIVDGLMEVCEREVHKSKIILSVVIKTRKEKMRKDAKIAVVSNFYGNLRKVLRDGGFHSVFGPNVIESAVVGVRKPDPEIFRIGMRKMGVTAPANVLVIGDSYDKDIVPAHNAGFKTVWFIGRGWTPDIPNGDAADWVITDLRELLLY